MNRLLIMVYGALVVVGAVIAALGTELVAYLLGGALAVIGFVGLITEARKQRTRK